MNTELTTSEFTTEQARRFTDEIKRDGQALWLKVAEAYDGRIWIALGYEVGLPGWQSYIAEEFPDGVLIPPRDRQMDAIQHYLSHEMSTRAIAQVTDLSKDTVARRAKEIREATGVSNETPGNVQGLDGKSYATTQPRTQEPEIEDAEIVSEPTLNTAPTPRFPAPTAPTAGPATPPATASPVDVSNVSADQLGLSPTEIDPNKQSIEHSKEEVNGTLRAYYGSGSSDIAQIKKTAAALTNYITSGMVDPEIWDEDELSVVAEQSVDAANVIADMLISMADGSGTDGISRRAIVESEVHPKLAQLKGKLDALTQAVNPSFATV